MIQDYASYSTIYESTSAQTERPILELTALVTMKRLWTKGKMFIPPKETLYATRDMFEYVAESKTMRLHLTDLVM